MQIVLIAVSVLSLWSVWGYFFSRVENVTYTVIEKKKDYEMRSYPARIVAQTSTIESNYQNSMNSGFSIVAGYIFGGNIKKEKIAMTAPVLVGTKGDSEVVSFSMPHGYTIDTLPTPIDSRVKLLEVPEQKIAVLRFSLYWSKPRIQKMKEKLLASLLRDNVVVIGSPSYAGYNGPGTPPWMIRNEILVEIQ